jgi:hypothetical protein
VPSNKRPSLSGDDNHKVGVGVNAWGPSLPAAYGTPTEAHLVRKKLKAPFPYFGGKSKVAPLVWRRLGDVDNYVEPFLGSGSVLLARPHPPRIETGNDLDCYVANFWRAVQHDPEAVAEYADWPVNEIDLHARHRWLVGIDPPSPWTDTPYLHAMAGPGKWARARAEFRERMRADPDHYDSKIAGWWCWGLCCWIGAGWCTSPAEVERSITATPALMGSDGKGQGVVRERPHEWQQVPFARGRGVAAAGPGLHQKRPRVPREHGSGSGGTMPGVHGRPQLADAYSRGRGVHGTDAADRYLSQKMPAIGASDPRATGGAKGVNAHIGTCASRRAWLIDWFSRLRDRLRTVRVCSGHWLRVCDSESVTTRLGMTGLFLDPPYRHALKGGEKNRDFGLYGSDGTHSDRLVDEVIAYCLERGDSPQMRIAACGYEGEGYEALVERGWECVTWSSQGGYANRNKKNVNRHRERLYFSPHCTKPDLGLFRDFA